MRERVLDAMAAAFEPARDPVASIDGQGRAGPRGIDWFAAAAGYAAVALIASLAVQMALRGSDPADGALVAATSTPMVVATAPDADMEPLIEASWLLEHAIQALPGPRRVMRADTASTIVALETRIAAIDAELGDPVGTDPDLREALWRDRVSAMSALYQVRFAQSRSFSF